MPKPAFPTGYITIQNYVEHLFPLLKEEDQPLHCVQQPGDLSELVEPLPV